MQYQNVTKWISRGGWAIVDQAIFSGANFLVGILLARWLSLNSFGMFSTGYSVFLFASALYTSIMTEPMLFFGSNVYKEHLSAYTTILKKAHWLLALLFAPLFFSALFFFTWDDGFFIYSLISVSVSAPFILYLWFARRVAYTILEPRLAVVGGGIYLSLYLIEVFSLYKLEILSPGSVFVAMGFGSLIASHILLSKIKLTNKSNVRIKLRDVLGLHWGYGRWASLASIFSWTLNNLVYLVLPMLISFDASAVFRAFYYLIMPVMQIGWALGGLFLPAYARLREPSKLKRAVFLSAALLMLLALSYGLILFLWGYQIIGFIFPASYLEYSGLLKTIGFLPVFVVLGSVFNALLRSLNKTHLATWAYGVGAVSVLLVVYPFVVKFGVWGAAYTWLIGQFLTTLILFLLGKRMLLGLKS